MLAMDKAFRVLNLSQIPLALILRLSFSPTSANVSFWALSQALLMVAAFIHLRQWFPMKDLPWLACLQILCWCRTASNSKLFVTGPDRRERLSYDFMLLISSFSAILSVRFLLVLEVGQCSSRLSGSLKHKLCFKISLFFFFLSVDFLDVSHIGSEGRCAGFCCLFVTAG